MKFGELFPKCESREPLALCDDISSTHGGPRADKEMDVIWLYCQFQYRPALLVALLPEKLLTAYSDSVDQHFLTPLGTPDEMIDDEMHMMLVVLILHSVHHVDILQ